MVFRITNLKYNTAPEKPVYELQKKSQQDNDKYIFFRRMPLGWSYGIKTVFDGGSKGFHSKGNISTYLVLNYHSTRGAPSTRGAQ